MTSSFIIALLVVVLLAAGMLANRQRLREWVERRRVLHEEQSRGSGAAGVDTAEPVQAGSAAARHDEAAPPSEDIFSIAASLGDLYSQSAHPTDLLENERFRLGVALLERPEVQSSRLIDYMVGANVIIACMALEALARRRDESRFTEPLLSNLTQVHLWTAAFALRVLSKRTAPEERLIARVLLAVADQEWSAPIQLKILREFIAERFAIGEEPSYGDALDGLPPERTEALAALTARLADVLPEPMVLQSSRSDADVALAVLREVGRIREAEQRTPAQMVVDERLEEPVRQIQSMLSGSPARSVVLVGDPGVGKSTLLRVLSSRLQADGWVVFECSAADLMAGQMFIGQLEARVQDLVRALTARKILWVIPNLHEMLFAGRHQNNPVGALELLLPHIERGEIRVAAEAEPAAFDRLLQAKPRLRSAMATARVLPASDSVTIELARRWAQTVGGEGNSPLIDDDTLRESFQLARQYAADKVAPGNLLSLLKLTHQRLAAGAPEAAVRMELDDVLVTLSQLTGLPLDILDDRVSLELDDLRALFDRRVIGQPEAVECLVERIAMIKAGVCDPSRPLGVFLFVGPTGTGKTEIAKTLAQYLFGSAERMIRLDMSEYQAPDAAERLLGGASLMEEEKSLLSAIRRQPFSVVLLDEFEKANSTVWDLFLQVFDDGRLTDRRGNLADFRHAIIILTSNLGATLPFGASVGFAGDQQVFTSVQVERAVQQTFRREFINRLDRVIIFRPLGRAEMREILRKELRDVLSRRAFRNRSWAVEWEDSAIDLLLQKGFTADLGARPLKRAIERYVLAPLALTLVNREAPEGDQFLFVRSDGERIEVQFVDPDAPDEERATGARREQSQVSTDGLSVRGLVLDASGSASEVHFLESRLTALAERYEAGGWEEQKDLVLANMREPDFWSSPDRQDRLGLAELVDRLGTALETAWSLLQRLSGSRQTRSHYPEEIVQRLAQQLYLLDAALSSAEAEEPQDAFLMVRALGEHGDESQGSDAFASRLGGMYVAWARKRRMRMEVVRERHGSEGNRYGLVAAISGFGAYRLLAPEGGLHVMEVPQPGRGFGRHRARVIVTPQLGVPAQGKEGLARQALASLAPMRESDASMIVRRYRSDPSPLVRDSARGWRSGRLDDVFGGDFDVMS